MPEEILSLKQLSASQREALLRELDFKTRGGLVYKANDEPLLDRYTLKHVRVDNLAIVPGSVIVLDDNPYSIASYLSEFEDL